MKRLLHILYTLVICLSLAGCEKDEWQGEEKNVPDGFMPINIAFAAPDMIEADTKAVDPDGKGINSITLFCFDNFGMFIHYVDNVQIEKAETGISLTGVITETSVPENTRRIHFVANQNMSTFKVDDFRGMSEYDVAGKLEGSSGMMIYWGYFAADGTSVNDSEDFQDALKAKHGVEKSGNNWVSVNGATPIRMLRNQARFQVNVGESGFAKTGFTVVNTNAFGTVAPYHPEKGFNFSMITEGNDWKPCDWTNDVFLTLPHNTTRLSPPEDVDKADETCVFETDNNSANPVSIIIKGHNSGETEDKYYRVILMDSNGEYVKVRRNFNYTINIAGNLSYGQATFEEALNAPATNNVWLSIDDDVKEVSNNTYSLSVKETSIVVLAENTGNNENPVWVLSKPVTGKQFDLIGNQVDLGYNIVNIDGSAISDADAPEASWVEGSNISNTEVINKFFDREVSVYLDKLDGLLDSPQIEGTILLKKGVLQRKIKIIVLNKMKFTPLWVSTQVNTDANTNVNLLFTVPESCPDELLPFKVYVSVDHLDIRVTSGRSFPIVTQFSHPDIYGADTYAKYDNNGNGEGNPIGYKYEYTVTQKGDQRMYFTNTVPRSESAGNLTEWVTLESAYFQTEKKAFTFNTSGDYRIEMPGLNIFDPTSSTDDNGNSGGDISQFSPDEQIKYMLVPQKKNAPVSMDIALVHNNADISVGTNDEFFFYSENLSHPSTGHTCHCEFKEFHEELWGTGGRIQAFKFNDDATNTEKTFNGGNRKVYTLSLISDKAHSEEVIRISSNHSGSKMAFDNSGTQEYNGNTYRSIIFELANYRPFRFAAEIQIGGNNKYGTTSIKDNNVLASNAAEQSEITDNVPVSYAPDQLVDIYLDITSFKGSDGLSVDPFGTEFYIYIVAPMLELGSLTQEQTTSNKLIKVKDGVFAYKVSSDRTTEKNSPFSTTTTAQNDDLSNSNPDQTGERKKLPFKKSRIVAEGDVIITTDPEEAGVSHLAEHNEQIVNYHSKKFKITSQKITGNIAKEEDGVTSPLDADAFVSFALTRNNSRIGSMKVTNNGENSTYELTLRPEYNFDWNDDNPNVDDIIVSHTHTVTNQNGEEEYEVFTANISSLASLYNTTAITLIKQDITQ